jgi:hypothetical protein
MTAMNKRMAKEMDGVTWRDRPLPHELSALVAQGFEELDGCVFLASLKKAGTNAKQEDFPDKTGYECFINSIHIDDFVQSDCLAFACLFIEACFSAWKQSGISGDLTAVISDDESGAVVKLHRARSDEFWVSSDLENYREEAVLVAHSSSMTIKI